MNTSNNSEKKYDNNVSIVVAGMQHIQNISTFTKDTRSLLLVALPSLLLMYFLESKQFFTLSIAELFHAFSPLYMYLVLISLNTIYQQYKKGNTMTHASAVGAMIIIYLSYQVIRDTMTHYGAHCLTLEVMTIVLIDYLRLQFAKS